MARIAKPYTQARAMFLKGHALKEISDELSIPYEGLTKFARRKGWEALRTQIGQAVSDNVQTTLEGRLGAWIGKVDTLVNSGIDNVLSKGIETLGLKELSLALDCAEKVHRMGRQHYGLDADKQRSPAVNVNVQVLRQQTRVKADGLPAIDVESERLTDDA